ncbi:MAG: hypothetical protein B7Z37_12365 [Verrucomicrobia bacterium 12-59-8]|nr:MAG: hypothetical protein B7Z37_12365 [Verrucomicrobia bacterium 12-59-8]
MKTLLVSAVCQESDGFASRVVLTNPGEHSLKLGTPGLKYGRPLAFKTRVSVYRASLNHQRPELIRFNGGSDSGALELKADRVWKRDYQGGEAVCTKYASRFRLKPGLQNMRWPVAAQRANFGRLPQRG